MLQCLDDISHTSNAMQKTVIGQEQQIDVFLPSLIQFSIVNMEHSMEDLTSKHSIHLLMRQIEQLKRSNDYEDACEYQRLLAKMQEAETILFNK